MEGVQIIYSQRKTIALEITFGGELLVRAPKGTSQATIARFVAAHQGWIERKRASIKKCEVLPPLSTAELAALRQQALAVLTARAEFYAPLVGVHYQKITIRAQKSRWGSCGGKGNLSFNCLLMLAPQEVQDYVVVHELCHLHEMNHGAGFWQRVAAVLPDYQAQERWLKEQGLALTARLPRT